MNPVSFMTSDGSANMIGFVRCLLLDFYCAMLFRYWSMQFSFCVMLYRARVDVQLFSTLVRVWCRCRDVVTEREKEMFSDIELNVDLHTSCEKDIKKYCRESTEKAKEAHLRGESPNGIVYKCLTEIFTEETSKKKVSRFACNGEAK